MRCTVGGCSTAPTFTGTVSIKARLGWTLDVAYCDRHADLLTRTTPATLKLDITRKEGTA